jgi:hypothetical protein
VLNVNFTPSCSHKALVVFGIISVVNEFVDLNNVKRDFVVVLFNLAAWIKSIN